MTRPDPVYEQAERAARHYITTHVPLGTRRYLYYLPHGLRLEIATDSPGEGWELADPRHISPAWTEAQARDWIYTTARRLPLYPVEEQAR